MYFTIKYFSRSLPANPVRRILYIGLTQREGFTASEEPTQNGRSSPPPVWGKSPRSKGPPVSRRELDSQDTLFFRRKMFIGKLYKNGHIFSTRKAMEI